MGIVGGEDRHYSGAGLGSVHAWHCPSCRAEQVGDPAQGCASCGSGTAKAYKAPENEQPVTLAPLKRLGDAVGYATADTAAERWADLHPGATLAEAFAAGYELARAQTIIAPPVTADTLPLAPEGKAARTIIAALRLFRDQALGEAGEEIASGEWCSMAEVDQLIRELEEKQ